MTLLRVYLAEQGLDRAGREDHPLFFNQHRLKLSRGGIAWLIGKYQTKTGDPTLVDADVSPHTIRHYVDGRVMLPEAASLLVAEPRGLVPVT